MRAARRGSFVWRLLAFGLGGARRFLAVSLGAHPGFKIKEWGARFGVPVFWFVSFPRLPYSLSSFPSGFMSCS